MLIMPIKNYFDIVIYRKQIIQEIEEKVKNINGFKPIPNILMNPQMSTYKQDIIISHKKLWYWIAYNIILNKDKSIGKFDYFYKYKNTKRPHNLCYCCEYTINKNKGCEACPLIFKNPNEEAIKCGVSTNYHNYKSYSYFTLYTIAETWQSKFYYAYKIAELEEREDIE